MTDTVTLYRADDGWRWRYEASGRCLADSGQGYSRRIDAVKGACRVVGLGQANTLAVLAALRGFPTWAYVSRDNHPGRAGAAHHVEFVVEATR